MIHALHKGTDLITPVKPDTIAKSIAIGNPADGYLRAQGGARLRRMGRRRHRPGDYRRDQTARPHRGIFAEPAGGTTLAVTLKLIEQGRIKPDETVVVSITGNGYKTLEAVAELDRAAVDYRRAAERFRRAVRTAHDGKRAAAGAA